ncbi:MAG: glucuronate isomerase [Oscillospiraceae bacterium]
MRKNYLLENTTAEEIYAEMQGLPICDYHCHLSPKEIYEDRVFNNIGEMWLGGDHYKWRLMRQAGVAEDWITGTAPWKEKFQKYAETVSMAGGNPLYAWSMMELSLYFHIDTPLNGDTAGEIYERAGRFIAETQLSPRKLMQTAKTEYVATTDDPADSLKFHERIAKDKDFTTIVTPTFRTDNLFRLESRDFPAYMRKLGECAGVVIDDLNDLRIALRLRLDAFLNAGCRYSDLGIEAFPRELHTRNEATPVFQKALSGKEVTPEEQEIYTGYLYGFLANEYCRHNLTMQLHLAAKRDANTALTAETGRDTGSDCVGTAVDCNRLIHILDQLLLKNRLPKTVIYTLNPQMNAYLPAICGTFPGVVQGAAWWYCDQKRGILEVMESIAETGYFGNFLGMLTDSRSFLSYARHDYFRRLLASLLAKWVQEDDFPLDSAQKLGADISYHNTKNRFLTQNG